MGPRVFSVDDRCAVNRRVTPAPWLSMGPRVFSVDDRSIAALGHDQRAIKLQWGHAVFSVDDVGDIYARVPCSFNGATPFERG